MLNELSKLIKSCDPDNVGEYDSRKVDDKYTFDGLTVSTVFTEDMGYETAILDCNKVYIVERYPDKKSANIGHFKWIEWINDKDNNEVQEIGYGSLVEPSIIKLERS